MSDPGQVAVAGRRVGRDRSDGGVNIADTPAGLQQGRRFDSVVALVLFARRNTVRLLPFIRRQCLRNDWNRPGPTGLVWT
jgi:hypothetical protein